MACFASAAAASAAACSFASSFAARSSVASASAARTSSVHRSLTAGECFLRNASSDLSERAPLCRRSVQSGLAAQTKAATPLKSAASPPNLAESKLFSVGEKRATTTPSTPPSPRTRAVRASTDATAEVGAASAGRWKTTRVSRSPPKTPSETSAVTYSCTAPGFHSSSGAMRTCERTPGASSFAPPSAAPPSTSALTVA